MIPSSMNMITITTPLADTSQRLNGDTMIMNQMKETGNLMETEMEQLEKKDFQKEQLSLPLVEESQRFISGGEQIIRSPIKVDVRVQFISKNNKPKTKKKRDQNISDNSDDDDDDED